MAAESRPVRARGLKHGCEDGRAYLAVSRPVRARGLKHSVRVQFADESHVAPRAGAWIETGANQAGNDGRRRRAPCGRVD